MKFPAIVYVGFLTVLAHECESSGPLRGKVGNWSGRDFTSASEGSDAPSDVPSFVPSYSPSFAPSDFPSAPPSKDVSVYEDTVRKGLDELNLLGFTDVQEGSSGFLTDVQGVDYSLSKLVPYTDLFSPDSFIISKDGKTVKHKASNLTIRIPVLRAVFDNNTIVQVSTSDQGNLSFAEIRTADPKYDTFFVQKSFASALLVQEDETVVSPSEALLSFTASDIDEETLANSFTLGDPRPLNRTDRDLEVLNDGELVITNSTLVKTVSAACQSFTIVKIAIAYDSELCGLYGSASAARAKIIAIVASASVLYERLLCVKLQLTDIYTPDSACGGRSKTFGGFDQTNICGGSGLIYDFADWMQPRRNALGIDKNALVHLFTGIPKLSSTIGCAFTGGFCTADGYGVIITSFSTNTMIQGIVVAHEIGHNLGAGHVTDSSNRFNYIMESKLTSGSDGFDQVSRNSILGTLARVSCDSKESGGSGSVPTPPTSKPPATAPTSSTTNVVGCRTKSEIAAPTCVSPQSSNKGGFACFNLKEILPPFCSAKSFRWVLDTCNGISFRKTSNRRLSNATAVVNLGSNTTNSTVQFLENEVASFESTNCAKPCVLTSGNQLCLTATGTSSHLVTVVAVNAAGKQVDRAFKRIFTVKATNTGSCRSASSKCVN